MCFPWDQGRLERWLLERCGCCWQGNVTEFHGGEGVMDLAMSCYTSVYHGNNKRTAGVDNNRLIWNNQVPFICHDRHAY